MKYFKRLGSIWFYVFLLVTSLFVISIIIYGFDLNSPGSRKALTSQLKNSSTVNYYYRIDDTFAFGVFTDRAPGDYDVHITTYTQNYVPFCFFCGFYTGDPDNDQGIMQPYQIGNVFYATEALTEDYMGLPAGAYPTLNLSTGVFSHVTNLTTLAPNPTDRKYRVTREYVSANFDEISFSSSDDEDCQIAFAAIFLCYIILFIWGIFALLFRRKTA